MQDQTRRKSAVTSFDVAREAGVSRASVSRAFQPGSNISPELRQHVLDVADRIGYRVNKMARGLNLQRSDLVGVIVSRLDNPYRASQVQELSSALSANGFHLVLFTLEPGEPVDRVLNLLLDYRVSGVVITSAAPDENVAEECARNEVPLILIDRSHIKAPVDHLRGDDDAGGAMVAEAFAECGRRFIHTFAPTKHIYSFERRIAALAKAADPKGIEIVHHKMEGYDYIAGYDATHALLQKCSVPLDGSSGLFFPNDIAALGALAACRNQGVSPPVGLGLMGYDDIPEARRASSRLSTIAQDPQELAEAVVDVLKTRISEPAGARKELVLPVVACLRDTH